MIVERMETAHQRLEPIHEAWRRFRLLRQPQPDRADALVVEGSLPAELAGAYLRNGPNPKFTPLGSFT